MCLHRFVLECWLFICLTALYPVFDGIKKPEIVEFRISKYHH